MVLWRLPKPVAGSSHIYKYRLYYGRGGVRIVGYDNERLKGDHRHLDGKESSYSFTSVDQLVSDLSDAAVRGHGAIALFCASGFQNKSTECRNCDFPYLQEGHNQLTM